MALLALLLAVVSPDPGAHVQELAPEEAIVSVARIQDRAEHNAFTDLTEFRGLRYDHVATLAVEGMPNETTLRFLEDGTMVALMRREGGGDGVIGTSRPPFREWEWRGIGARLGGPNLIVLPNGGLLAASRRQGDEERTTVLARVTTEGAWRPLLTLPSGGDTSYAGLCLRDEELLVSYYSSHEGKASIYLATLRLAPLLAE